MSVGQGNISFTTKQNSGGGGAVAGARNGLSIDALLNAVLGQDVGEVGNPAALLSDREIPLSGFILDFLGNNIETLLDDTNSVFKVINNAGDQQIYFGPNTQDIALGDWDNYVEPVMQIRGNLGGANNPLVDFYVPKLNGDYANVSFFCNPQPKFWVTLEQSSINKYLDIRMEPDWFEIQNPNAGRIFSLNQDTDRYIIGDMDGTISNGTKIIVDNGLNEVQINNTANNAIIEINGVDGFTGTVSPVNSITVNGGIVTAVS